MKVILLFLLVLLVAALLIVPFTREMVKDKLELQKISIDKKFQILIENLNQGLMFGEAEVVLFDDNPSIFNMFSKNHPNRILHFSYATGHLVIEMGYKYFQHELRFNKRYYHLRDVSVFVQKNIARDFIETAQFKMREHETKVGEIGVASINDTLPPISGVRHEESAMQLLDNFFANLSREQQVAMVNHLAVIYSSTTSQIRYDNAVVQQQMLMMNVSEETCRKALQDYGEQHIYDVIKKLRNTEDRDTFIDLHVQNCLVLIKNSADCDDDLDMMGGKMLEGFAVIGISEEEVEQRMMRLEAFNKFIRERLNG
jgi:hypothetical protein